MNRREDENERERERERESARARDKERTSERRFGERTRYCNRASVSGRENGWKLNGREKSWRVRLGCEKLRDSARER